ncbi:MAG: hypothetical protein A3C10_03065 [Candidatus Magasanikbacteria bacterium RIFCSPHIGHO2_02_FULL_48_18]|nr:MAG: hypothetical protein A3C10_03065 [Candidatus Magasanikbacteria bacterium RIFCSPHIGHO2_02_FULL_48_18]
MILGIDASRANHDQKTGVEWYAFFLIEEMKKLTGAYPNLRVVLYADQPLRGSLARMPQHWTQKVLSWPPRRLWTQFRLSWEMLLHPPDVLFIPAHVFPIIHPKKTVMTVHDVAAFRFPKAYSWFERWYSIWSASYAARRLWKVIVPSFFSKKELLALLTAGNRPDAVYDSERIMVIPHGYDPAYGAPVSPAAIDATRKKFGIGGPFLLAIGRLEYKKNTAILIHAFENIKQRGGERVQNLALVLAGKPGVGYETIASIREASPYRKDIIETGWISNLDARCLMKVADVFVFPSLYEGFGMPVLEAFASGTPAVVSKGNSLEEVGGSAALYADPTDLKQVEEALFRLVTDSHLREEYAQKGLSRVRKFSWRSSAEKTVDVLLNAMTT